MTIPRLKQVDSSISLLSEGYLFVKNRCDEVQSDIFETRILFEKVLCFYGEEAAAALYNPDLFTRKRAMPAPGLMLLQDFGSTQLLDDSSHQHRKSMLLSLMGRASIEKMVDLMTEEWLNFMHRWESRDRVILHGEFEEILCRAACKWAGVPLSNDEAKERTRELAAMIDGAGSVGPRNLRGHFLRGRTERWARGLIHALRAGKRKFDPKSPISVIATHRGLDGQVLPTRVAAVELINLLRPTVAVARYATFAAHALHFHPECRTRILNEPGFIERFVQEVRRFYPFFPVVGGRARKDFEWKGHSIRKNQWVLLDLYGTNHDPRVWRHPDQFDPDRFKTWNKSPNNFVPQGGGNVHTGHRCAGEWLTISLLKRMAFMLCRSVKYTVPAQDLTIHLNRFPAIPESRFIIENVHAERFTGQLRQEQTLP